MRLFRCRPLAASCALFIFALFSAYFLPLSIVGWLLPCLGGAALIWLIFRVLRGFGYRSLFLFLAILGLFFGCLRVFCEQKASKRVWDTQYGQRTQADLTVSEILYTNTYGTELLVDVVALDGKGVASRAVLRGDVQLPFYVGDRIQATLTVQALDFEAFSEESEFRYRGKGAKALLIAESGDDLTLLTSGTNMLPARLLDLRAVLSHRIARAAGGEEGKLLAAMLLGSKDLLGDQTVRDFSFSGVSHLLALSGLHLMLLVGILERLLYLLGAGKRLRIVILLPLCVFYLMLTGCNYSLLRALFMLGFVYLCAVLREEHDPVTALLLSGTVILLFTPYAIFSVSFQMTMLATFGILAFVRIQALLGNLFPKGKRLLSRLLWRLARFACSSLLLSASTTLALLPVLWLEIGSYAVITPLSNLLMVLLAPLVLIGALLALLPIPFVGTLAAFPAKLLLLLARLFASGETVISLNQWYIPFIVIPVLCVTTVLLLVDLKRFYPLSLAPAFLCALAFTIILFAAEADQSISVIYRQSGKNEGIVLVRGSEAMICDLSATSLTQLRADWREAQQVGATHLRVLLLTHYHSKSPIAVSKLAKSTSLGELWLPAPQDEAEQSIFKDLLLVALQQDIPVSLYDENDVLSVFDTGELLLSKRYYRSRSTEPAFSLSLSYRDTAICYHTASYEEYLNANGAKHACEAEHLILGAHGPVPKREADHSEHTAQSVLIADKSHHPFFRLPAKAQQIVAPSLYRYEME